ncbi:hypothetical protein [Adhaeribacter terrigena]|nr:hypothetical protein [Adhaeribacter terrigena]
MKKFTAISSLFVLGTVGLLVTAWLNPVDIELNFSDEEYYLYL